MEHRHYEPYGSLYAGTMNETPFGFTGAWCPTMIKFGQQSIRLIMLLIIGMVGDMTQITPIPACLSVEAQNCINSFHNFAYEIPISFQVPKMLIPPLLPWQHIETIPAHHISGYQTFIHHLDVTATREIHGKTECSDPKKLDTKVPVLILTTVLAVEPTNLPRIQPG
jgi:hypothetical protein